MLLTAQRVVSPKGVTGVNVYQFLHGSYIWVRVPSDFLPDTNPGELVDQLLEVPPGDNRIVSYLDVVLPDETSSTDVLQCLASLKHRIQPVHTHVEAFLDPYWIRFGSSIDARMRPTELGALSGHILLSLSGNRPSRTARG